MIRVCFVITGLSVGGAETMLLKLLKYLDRRRFEPHVISLTHAGSMAQSIRELDIDVHAMGLRPGIPSPLKFLALVRLIKQIKPDLVHTWMYHADLLGGLAARRAGVSAIAWCIRNSDLSPKNTKWLTRVVARINARVSKWLPVSIISCSQQASAAHVEIGYASKKMQVLPNGFELDRFKPSQFEREAVRSELGLEQQPVVGLIARFDPLKNHRGFLRAATLIAEQVPDVAFVLAGSGIDSSNAVLVEWVREAGLESRVRMLGVRKDMPRVMAALDLLVSSSIGEAFPNVLGEAMASGVPCVVTDAGDSAEIVGSTGGLVSSDDMQALAAKVVALLQAPAEERARLSIAARERIESRYEIRSVAAAYERCYEQLIKEA